MQLPGLGGALQAPGGDVLPAGRGLRRRPLSDLALARPRPGDLLGRLRELRADGTSEEPRGSSLPAAGSALALGGLTWPGDPSERLDRFWQPSAPLPARPAIMNVEPDLLLQQLPLPDAALGGQTLVDRFRAAYQRFGASE